MFRKPGAIFSISALVLLTILSIIKPGQAAYIVNLDEVGPNVVATGGGTIDLTDLTLLESHRVSAPFIVPASGDIFTGAAEFVGGYEGLGVDAVTGPSSFGSGAGTRADFLTATGDMVGLEAIGGTAGNVFVPAGYISGRPLADTATYDSETFASLGVTPGTYVWTWGSGPDADSFTLQIGPTTTVPEPASLVLFGTALLGFGVMRRRRAS